jgi:transcriptional regulator with XRE-family HTH domain
MSEDTSIGQRVQSVRKRRGLTQGELAAASGLSASLVRKLEQGTITDIRLETARKLAVGLRVSTTALLCADREEPDSATVSQWQPVRDALAGRPGEPGDEPTPQGVREAVAAIRPALARNRVLRAAAPAARARA